MKTTTLEQRLPRAGADRLSSLASRAVRKGLKGLCDAQLRIVEDGQSETFGTPGSDLSAEVRVHDARLWTATLLRGQAAASC